MNTELLNLVKGKFSELFSGEPVIVRSPGRINIIGEHTDYNLGFVLPAAVGHGIYFAVSVSGSDDACTLHSIDMNETYSFNISKIAPLPQGSWQNYLLGVVSEILKTGKKLQGFNLVFAGDVPRGSGMSSSAALECGTCFALNELFTLGFSRVEMVKMSQKAEHNYAGVMCGIMDQFASMMGKQDQVLLLDCKTLAYEHFPMKLEGYSLVLCNSNVSHSLASSEYNVRRKQCEEGVAVLNAEFGGIESLRDANLKQLESCKSKLSDVVYRRCKYVIEENDRLQNVTIALKSGALKTVGDILKSAQKAMESEYEITCPEIDFMADFANSRADVLGARMMGGGFGGCTINLVETKSLETFIAELNVAYLAHFRKEITPIAVNIADGVGLITK